MLTSHRWRLALSLLLFVLVSNNALAQVWKAGHGRVIITPKKNVWLSGYGSRNRPAEATLHDLWAKALVIEAPGGQRAALITLDLIGIDRDTSQSICHKLEKRFGLERHEIAITTSHTHTSPVVGGNLEAMYLETVDDEQWKLIRQYTAALEDLVVSVVGDAIARLAPSKLSWANGSSTIGVNRRNNVEKNVPELRKAGKLVGPVDYDVPVLAVRGGNGTLRAVVFGYACHATVLSFYKYSGDYPGFAQLHFERRHPDVTALFWAGCGGDINPLPRREVALADDYGRRLASSVDDVLAGLMHPVNGRLRTLYEEIALPLAELPSRVELEERVKSENRYQRGLARLLLRKLDDGTLGPTYPYYPVQVWHLGNDLRFVLLGGEVVVDYSLRLKRELGRNKTWVAGYANDVMAYIPSVRVLREGGYEGNSSMIYYGLPSKWAEPVEELIIDAVHRLAKRRE